MLGYHEMYVFPIHSSHSCDILILAPLVGALSMTQNLALKILTVQLDIQDDLAMDF
jgi:hypothetical protein